jgi:putative addiction module component (TIGR02574 family)
MPPSIFDLSDAEKLQLVQDLWDDLATDPKSIPVYQWQQIEVADRKARLLGNPDSGLDWEEVKRRARVEYGR